ncbi:MAG TPA: CDP-diacylglycerol--serine O-phosphatidyltransferase, partial [Thermoanaerobaculia bacterium]|nr:CDP-diacylglycerol--serine O-phosphatidyltransferase [Thermoanaerobaculia bacterium]
MARKRRSRSVERRLRRGAYLLPSLFTTGNLLLGFASIILGLDGAFRTATVLVFVAGILDAFDGRLARLTGTESEFGREYDSLADLFTFGAAPALLSYLWGLRELRFWGVSGLGRLGWLIPLFYLVCAAVRLARFNVQTKVVDSRFFVGLPSPAAAGAICSLLFFAKDLRAQTPIRFFLAASLILVGSLMVSTFRYVSFKQINLRQRWSYRMLLIAAALVLTVAIYPPAFFLTVAVIYTASGPLSWL